MTESVLPAAFQPSHTIVCGKRFRQGKECTMEGKKGKATMEFSEPLGPIFYIQSSLGSSNRDLGHSLA